MPYTREISFPEKELPLKEDISVLGTMLGDVLVDLKGQELLDLVEKIRIQAIERREANEPSFDALENMLEGLDDDRAVLLLRAFSSYLRLANLAEKTHRIRRRRVYLRDGEAEQKGSFSEVIGSLKRSGIGAEELQTALDRLQVLPVFTAHPTEATRRTILEKEYSIIHRLVERLNPALTPEEESQALARIRDSVTSGWQTRPVSSQRPTVADELDNVLFYLTEIIYRIIPPYVESLQAALNEAYQGEVTIPDGRAILQFGSWVGADMDGNPNVNGETIAQTLHTQRRAIIGRYIPEVKRLSRYLSQTVGDAKFSEEVMNRLAQCAQRFPELEAQIPARYRDMPYRCLLHIVAKRLDATRRNEEAAYASAASFVADISLVADSLRSNQGEHAGLFGVQRLLTRAEAFGFHLATLDARQDSQWHRTVLAELFDDPDWENKSAQQRNRVLVDKLSAPVKTAAEPRSGSEQLQSTLGVFRTLDDSIARYGRDAVGLFIISMTQGADDVLAAMYLSKIAAGESAAPLDIAPLLETVDDLVAGRAILEDLLEQPGYRAHLQDRGNKQYIMVGYSDSNKDSGMVAARWALQQAQLALLEVARGHDIELVFFHGRGGTVSRGGGNLVNGILGAPAGSIKGAFRVTEQGEVINQKYGIRPLALRNLELVTGAMLQHNLADTGQHPSAEMNSVMAELADNGRARYRSLVYENPDFVPFFRSATPIDVIEKLQIGSRPASRRSGLGIGNLRAIPWVFSWAQIRVGMPGVYGFGTALDKAISSHGIDVLRDMYERWAFFRGMVSDVEMVLAKSDLVIGRRYAALADPSLGYIFEDIVSEFALARRSLLDIRQGKSLLDEQPTLKRNIRLRNPYVDPLHLIQIRLLKRWRDSNNEDSELLQALKTSVNGIALGIQNTG